MSTKAHVLLVLMTLGSLLFILRLVGRRVLRAKYALLWLTVGMVLVVMAAVPGALDAAAEWMGVNYEPALFLMLALAFLFVLAVHFSWELSRLEERVRRLAEEIALLRQTVDSQPDRAGDARVAEVEPED